MSIIPNPELRPLRAGEIIDTALQLFSRNWQDLVKIVALVVGPIQLLAVLALATFPSSITPGASSESVDGDVVAGFIVAAGITALATGLAALVAVAGATRAVGQAYLGEQLTWTESLRYGLHRLGGLVLMYLLVGLVAFVPVLVFALAGGLLAAASEALGVIAAVVGVILLIALIFRAMVVASLATPALLIERLGAWEALKRTNTLVKGRFWPTFWALILTFVLLAIVRGVVVAVFAIVGGFAGGGVVASALGGIGEILGTIVATPVLAAVTVVAYVDLRVRKEGLDIEMLSRDVTGGSGTSEPPPVSPGW